MRSGSGNKTFTAIHVEMTDILSDKCSTCPVATSLSDSHENYANDSRVVVAYCARSRCVDKICAESVEESSN